jgi:hypothetical protein
VLRITFGPKRKWLEKIACEELNDFCCSPNITPKWQIWKRREMHTEFWWGNVRGRDHLEDQSVDGVVFLFVWSKY